MEDKIYKFGIIKEDETEEEFLYSDLWCLEDYPKYKRIAVAPRDNHIRIILDLLKEMKPPYWNLYVLVIPRSDNKPGRYQCARPLSFEDVSSLLIKYTEYFENDGRHHIWLGSTVSNELIIYDHHNILYLYHIESQALAYLNSNNFKEEIIELPIPHTHFFHSEYDKDEIDLITNYEWMWFPLQEQDY